MVLEKYQKFGTFKQLLLHTFFTHVFRNFKNFDVHFCTLFKAEKVRTQNGF